MSRRIFSGMQVNEALAVAAGALSDAGVPGAARDARVLMGYALWVPVDRISLMARDLLEADAAGRLDAAIELRRRRVPVSHITGRRMFYGRNFHVSPLVLDPRPETECLIECALSLPFQRVLDLGTGSGCILVTLLCERPGATGVGTDIATGALGEADVNAGELGVAKRAEIIRADWFAPFHGQGGVDGRFDLIVSNPPYIAADEMAGLAPELAREPRCALTDEGDGLGAYRRIAAGVRDHLRPGGRLLLEIGPTQAAAVSQMLAQAGMEQIAIHPDLDGRDRVVSARAPG